MEKIKPVSNPLTIVAIFAGLAEIASTTAIALIREDLQDRFIWFVMFFPVSLVLLFFLTLLLRPTVFYAPSDFREEANYMQLFKAAVNDAVAEQARESREIASQKIAIVLDSGERRVKLPLQLRRGDVTRTEVLGLIGMIPRTGGGQQRYSLKYLSKPEFLEQLNQIKDSAELSSLIIKCDAEELLQFALDEFS